nr:peptidylprolyl isomerase [uncultured Capnocytophaga sp.]
MKWFLLFISILVLGCNTGTTEKKVEGKVVDRKVKDSVDTKLTTVMDFPEVPLTTDTAIPFLFEYEKRHKERWVRIITKYGNIDIELFSETPYHRANFIFLANQKYFDGTVFHRVVKDFVIQGGNSERWEISRRRASIGSYLLPPDTKKGFKHHRGIVSMPSSDIDNPHQFASPYEFFIVVQKPGAYHLDGHYTAFGKVISGMDVVDKINSVETEGRDNWPKRDIEMKVIILNK